MGPRQWGRGAPTRKHGRLRRTSCKCFYGGRKKTEKHSTSLKGTQCPLWRAAPRGDSTGHLLKPEASFTASAERPVKHSLFRSSKRSRSVVFGRVVRSEPSARNRRTRVFNVTNPTTGRGDDVEERRTQEAWNRGLSANAAPAERDGRECSDCFINDQDKWMGVFLKIIIRWPLIWSSGARRLLIILSYQLINYS